MYNFFFEHSAKQSGEVEEAACSCKSGESATSCCRATAPSSLTSHHAIPSPVPPTSTAPTLAKRENRFYCPPNYSTRQLPPNFEDPGCLGNISWCCCGNSPSLTSGFPCHRPRRWGLSATICASRWQEMALPPALSIKLQNSVNRFYFHLFKPPLLLTFGGEKNEDNPFR